MEYFAEVILPLALPQNYTYRIAEGDEKLLRPGMRVVVPLGKRKLYTGLVRSISHRVPKGFEPKEIMGIEDSAPIVTEAQLQLWEWIAQYYLCSMGEVMNAALPSGLKLESETLLRRNHLKEVVDQELSDLEYLVVEALDAQDQLSIKEISAITDLRNPMQLVLALLSKQYVQLQEELKGGYKPVKKRKVRMMKNLTEKDFPSIFDSLQRAPKQSELLMGFLRYSAIGEHFSAARLLKLAKASEASLQGLAKKNILEIFWEEEAGSSSSGTNFDPKLPKLNTAQTSAYQAIIKHWQDKDTVLLHGVTASGKTEIYVQLMAEHLAQGRQVLYLVPEIALTTQLIQRMKRYFGEALLVYHSRFSDRDRVESWLELVENKRGGRLVIGARSALFLPFGKLALVLVDEEHETSYKQYDPAPRYHARDSALVLARLHGAKVLLGSATPSFESYYNARREKYGLVELSTRFGDIALPQIRPVSLKEARLKKELHGHFTQTLIEAMEHCLKQGQQIILFQNRRGFSTFLQCETCGHVLQCKHCDISLTYHRGRHQLRCHYCGYATSPPQNCPACKSHQVRSLGFGTEKLEDDLKLMFPAAQVQRMDFDTTRNKSAYENIIGAFEEGQTDILVGTQMVTKGLDFENVGLVGIMSADSMLHFPDFRSFERAYQVMAQVAGRAGRKGKQGQVIIQVSDPEHKVIRWVIQNQYRELYLSEMQERRIYFYPPFYRLIRLRVKHKKQPHLEMRAGQLAQYLRRSFGNRLLGPEYPMATRLRGWYQMEMMLKLEPAVALNKAKEVLQQSIEDYEREYPKNRIQIIFDVDPY